MADRNVLINENTMLNIAEAIRGKTGKTDKILPANMPAEIASIETSPKLINFTFRTGNTAIPDTIQTYNFQAVEGMTWGEWLFSKYNTEDVDINGTGGKLFNISTDVNSRLVIYVVYAMAMPRISLNGVDVTCQDTIVSGAQYEATYHYNPYDDQ